MKDKLLRDNLWKLPKIRFETTAAIFINHSGNLLFVSIWNNNYIINIKPPMDELYIASIILYDYE